MAASITGAIVVAVLGVYGLITVWRRARIRRAADELGAAYFPEGLSGPGRIVGPRYTVVEVRLPGYRPPNDAGREALWRWLHPGSTARRLESNLLAAARIRRITIGDGEVATFFNGIVTDIARLRSTLDLLGRLASDDRRAAVGEVS